MTSNHLIPNGYVRFQVNGKIYDLSIENLKKYETTLSNMMIVYGYENTEPIIIDEDSTIFKAILSYHRTGIIVRPPAIASELWDNRVKYWNLELSSDTIKDKTKYYMLDFVLYFGQRFIKSYNPHEQTLIMIDKLENEYENICLMKYDINVPFIFFEGNVLLIIGMGLFDTDLIQIGDDDNIKQIKTNCMFENSANIVIQDENNEKVKQGLINRLKEAIEYLLKDCKRNKTIENALWEEIFSHPE